MMIDFRCPKCGHHQSVKQEFVGREIPCGYCGQTVHVPEDAGESHPVHEELLAQAGLVKGKGGRRRRDHTLLASRIVGVLVILGLIALGWWGWTVLTTPIEPETFTEFVGPKNTFAVTFPLDYDVVENDMNTRSATGVPIQNRTYTVDSRLYVMRVKVIDAPFEVLSHGRPAAETAHDMLKREFEEQGLTLKNVSTVQRKRFGVLHGTAEGPNGRKGVGEAYILQNRSYLLTVTTRQGNLQESQAVKKFFEDFEVRNP